MVKASLIIIQLFFIALACIPVEAISTCGQLFSQRSVNLNPKSLQNVKRLMTQNLGMSYQQEVLEILTAIVRDPIEREQLREQLPQLIEIIRVDNDSTEKFRQSLVRVLNLIVGDVDDWWQFITGYQPVQTGLLSLRGDLGQILIEMPPEFKNELLKKLGRHYPQSSWQWDRESVVWAIQVLLEPNRLYREARETGQTDREFYNKYLSRIKEHVFSDTDVAGYPGEQVIAIARLLQEQMENIWIQNSRIDAVYFFGSVVNGFGKVKSDLDIFVGKTTSLGEVAQQLFNPFFYWALSAQRQFLAKTSVGQYFNVESEQMRRQLYDKKLQEQISVILAGTPWQWVLKESKHRASDHLMGAAHVFCFYITRQKIELRFYPEAEWTVQSAVSRAISLNTPKYRVLDIGDGPQ